MQYWPKIVVLELAWHVLLIVLFFGNPYEAKSMALIEYPWAQISDKFVFSCAEAPI
jgi:hypothetical protein